jgi:hypothetical protein
MSTREPRAAITPFFYKMGDESKAPVDHKAQPVGTLLVSVTPWGREIPFTTVAPVTKDKAARDASLAAAKAQPAGYEG